jgi:cytochrome P450
MSTFTEPRLESLESEVAAFFALRPDLVADPFPLYSRMREEAPVLILGSVASLTRYADVEAVFRNLTDHSSRRGGGSRTAAAASRLDARGQALLHREMDFEDLKLTSLDPPEHTRVRGLAHRVFTPRRMAEMRATVESILADLIDKAAEKGTVDLVDEVAYELPLFVIGAMLGVPPEDRHRVRHWSTVKATFTGTNYANLEEAVQATVEFRAYVRELVAERRKTRHTDLLAALLEPDPAGDKLGPDELEAMFVLLLFAGHETTTNLIANGVNALLTHPDQLQRLRDDPGLVPNAVEEFLRWTSPSQLVHRVAARTTVIRGVTVPEGTTIRLVLGAANRDPERFENPEELDVGRADIRHLGFGIGPHYCLGQALARMETALALSTLIERFPDMELAGEVRWRANLTLRGLQALPVRLH